MAALAAALKDREARRAGLTREFTRLEDRQATARIDPHRIERDLRKRVAEWRRLQTEHTPIARQIVMKLLEDRIVWTPQPEKHRYLFEGHALPDRLFAGVIPLETGVPSVWRGMWDDFRNWLAGEEACCQDAEEDTDDSRD